MEAPFALPARELRYLASHIRQKVFEICRTAKSGHIGGSSAAVELLCALYCGGVLRYDISDPRHPERDRVLIRGHIGPTRYALFNLLGWVTDEELMTYRKFGSRLHGHEDYLLVPGIDITPSGSLGMVLSYGVGCSLSACDEGRSSITYVFIGDGEEQEGNISEAARHAAHLRLPNLIAIIDRNRKQLSDPVEEVDSASIETVWRGYGWNVVALEDAHDFRKIIEAFEEARVANRSNRKPSVIVANTKKGLDLAGAKQHFSGYHTASTCPDNVIDKAIGKLRRKNAKTVPVLLEIKKRILRAVTVGMEPHGHPVFQPAVLDFRPSPATPNHPDKCQGDYFLRLKEERLRGKLAGQEIYFLTADVTRHDHVEALMLRDFCHYHNVGIREQHLIALAHGLSLTNPSARIIINSFDAFMYRWMDQVYSAVQGRSSMVIIADVSGLTNAQNGRTHQSSGQPGAILMLPDTTFLEPWDAEDTFNCLNWAIGQSRGVVYLRVHSSLVNILPGPDTERNIRSYVAWEPKSAPVAVLIASGLTVSYAIEAARLLGESGFAVRVVNIVSHKDPGKDLFEAIVPDRPVLTLYNGVADVLQSNVAKMVLANPGSKPALIKGLGFDFGTTGTLDDLRAHFGFGTKKIAEIIKQLVSRCS